MRPFRVGVMALCALLAGCLLPGPNDPPQATPHPGPSGPPVVPSGSGFMPPPVAPDMSNVAYAPSMRPNSPCPGDTVHVSGLHFNGAKRVTVWLKGDTPEQATIVNTYPIDNVPYAVKVGDVTVQPDGSFQLDFVLKSEMLPVSTGGRLLVEPGHNLTLVFVDDGSGMSRGIGFTVGTACSASPLPGGASLHLEPAYPCFGEPVTVVGQGFTGSTQTLEFHRADTRFGDGPSHSVDAPIAPDGTLRYTFRLDDLSDLVGTASEPRAHTISLYAFDNANNQKLTVPMPICNAALGEALNGSSIPLDLGMQGQVDLANGQAFVSPSPDESETTVIRSQAELEAFGARHHLTGEAIALLPRLDFTKQEGLMVLTGPFLGSEEVEIMAVERLADHDQVHAVIWGVPSPLFGPGIAFHLVAVSKSDHPAVFATARGDYTQRNSLAPSLATRRIPVLRVGPGSAGPRVDTP